MLLNLKLTSFVVMIIIEGKVMAVMAAVLVHVTIAKTSLGNLTLFVPKPCAKCCHCFYHQHGCLITWLHIKNIYLSISPRHDNGPTQGNKALRKQPTVGTHERFRLAKFDPCYTPPDLRFCHHARLLNY